MVSVDVIDGGDQIAALLTLLLIPITLLDKRKWHWFKSKIKKPEKGNLFTNYKYITGWIFYIIIRVQVSVIYFQTAIGKLEVEQWKNGTALYYYITDPWYGASNYLKPFLKSLALNSTFGILLTWSVMLVEILLFAALFMSNKLRLFFLKMGLFFHLIIIFTHGLPSFFFSMAGALVLYLHPLTENILSQPYWLTKISSLYKNSDITPFRKL